MPIYPRSAPLHASEAIEYHLALAANCWLDLYDTDDPDQFSELAAAVYDDVADASVRVVTA